MGLLDKLKELIGGREDTAPVEISEDNLVELPIDEEDRLVVALAASIMAGKDKNNSYFHIKNIKRIK